MNPEIVKAIADREAAENRFNCAEGEDLINAAIYEIKAAESRLQHILKTVRTGEVLDERAGEHGYAQSNPIRRLGWQLLRGQYLQRSHY
ncbi:MAG: hypothetical protein HPY55_06655 [Firmicutes bacterium]|nr:hypothetical protein [Bacillota bacterium]